MSMYDNIKLIPRKKRLALVNFLKAAQKVKENPIKGEPQSEQKKPSTHFSFKKSLKKVHNNIINQVDSLFLVNSWGKGLDTNIDEIDLYKFFHKNTDFYLHKTAITMSGVNISYKDLLVKVDALSSNLIQMNFASEPKIVVALPRSPEMIFVILAILKSGYVYVPLDISQPERRIVTILNDLNPDLVISQVNIIEKFGSKASLNFFFIENFDWKPISSENFEASIKPNQLAYIIYTSGTTGNPKGVMIEHRSVVNFIDCMKREFEVTPNDRILQFANISFDVSVFEIFTALCSGATLVIANDKERLDPFELNELLIKENITLTELPPAILPTLQPKNYPKLRLLSVGGEKFPASIIEPWFNNTRKIINGYGPTEATVAVTIHCCKPGEIPYIGKPIQNHSAYVLTKDNSLASVGEPGELAISGIGLSRGYLNHPKLTSEKFVKLKLDSREINIYKTGDLASWHENGCLEILGRIDKQVKIRGYRIELEEIESAILKYDNIKQAIVTSEEAEEGNFLTAYILTNEKISISELKHFLIDYIPSYMMPKCFVFLKKIPVNERGKIDYEALKKIEKVSNFNKNTPSPEERNEIDEKIYPIFCKLLANNNISLNDNFFYVGGDSLLSAKVVSEIRAAFNCELRLADFLKNPTIKGVSKILANLNSVNKNNQEAMRSIISSLEEPWFINKVREYEDSVLLYFHCAGGSAYKATLWAKYLEKNITLLSVQLPGHDQRITESPVDNIFDLASLILPEIQHLSTKSIYLMGHSMGALLAFEIAKKLEEISINPKILITIASRSPNSKVERKGFDTSSDQEFLEKLNEFGGVNLEVFSDRDFLNTLMPAIRADVKASQNYFSEHKIKAPILSIIGENDQLCTREMGIKWAKLTLSGFLLESFPGGHFFIEENGNKAFIDYLNKRVFSKIAEQT